MILTFVELMQELSPDERVEVKLNMQRTILERAEKKDADILESAMHEANGHSPGISPIDLPS